MRPYALAVFAAALFVGGYSAGLGFWPLACLAIAPLAWTVERERLEPMRALRVGVIFELSSQLCGLAFLPSTLTRFSNMPWLASVLVYCLLSLAQSCGAALFLWALAVVKRRGANAFLIAPALWGLSELIAPQIFPTPFGAAVHDVLPLAQLAELGGVTLVSMLMASIGCAIAALIAALVEHPRGQGAAHAAMSALAIAAIAGVGALRGQAVARMQSDAPSLRVGLVQPNLEPSSKRADPRGFTATHAR